MTRELQLRDVEILAVFEALAPGSDNTDALVAETMKRCDCSASRIDDAIKAVQHNPEHIYWRN